MKIVISIGGSLLSKEPIHNSFRKYADVLLRLKRKGHRLIVVCGGGKLARQYRDIAKNFTKDREKLDFIGIMATHLNATLMAAILGNNAYLLRWQSLKSALKELKRISKDKIVVAAGYDVGVSTDYDTAKFAEAIDADLVINATNVDGVYSEDPRKYKNAKKFKKLSYNDFLKIIRKLEQIPGEYRLFDLKGARLLSKMGAKLIIIDGRNAEKIIKAVEGKHGGTTIE
mgnify:CR=1 FL=1